MRGTHFSVGRLSYVIQVGQSNHGFLKAENLSKCGQRGDDNEGSGRCDTASFEDVGRGSSARNVSSLKSGKGKETDSSVETPERNGAL